MLNENIKTLRKAKNLSQEELAVKLNVVRQTISKWEKALSVPDAGMLIKLAEALDTTVNTLLGDELPKLEEKQEDVKFIAAKLELLNEQFAARSERNRKLWRTVFVILGILTLVGIVKEVIAFAQLYQFRSMVESSESIIGGADEPSSIFISNISLRNFTAIMTIIYGIIAAIGIHHTRRK